MWFENPYRNGGGKVLYYVPDNTYLVDLPTASRKTVAALPEVRWIGPWHPAFRIDPSISGKDLRKDNLKPFLADDDFPWKNCVVRTRVDLPKSTRAIAEKVKELGGRILAQNDSAFQLLVTLKDGYIRSLSRENNVLYIERFGTWFSGQPSGSADSSGEAPAVLGMGELRAVLGADYVQKHGGYRGAGVRCAVIDTPPRESHVDLFERISYVGPQRVAGHTHGTAVCGILIGDGTADPKGCGLLPKGRVLFEDSGFRGLSDRYAVTKESLKQGAVLQSDSSRSYNLRWYDVFAAELDDLILRYDILYCRAAGNTGNRSGSSWGKNVVSVGGIEHNDTLQRSGYTPWKYSTRCPAPDGRIKPDLVAFSHNVFTVGSATDRDYNSFGGTSCATPMVAGCFGLLVEMWADGVFTPRPLGISIADRKPHAATAKALLINTAYQFPFTKGKNGFHRFNQGWGMPDLRNLYNQRHHMFVVNADRPVQSGQAVTYRLTSNGDRPLRLTLAWTDAPAMSGTTRSLVNDLDLDVTSPDGTHYYGNHGLFTDIWSKPDGNPDILNNVEQVLIKSPQPGEWVCRVSTRRVAMDQNTSNSAFDQAFALVTTGITEKSK
jgi:serine protease AprX